MVFMIQTFSFQLTKTQSCPDGWEGQNAANWNRLWIGMQESLEPPFQVASVDWYCFFARFIHDTSILLPPVSSARLLSLVLVVTHH